VLHPSSISGDERYLSGEVEKEALTILVYFKKKKKPTKNSLYFILNSSSCG
jgi:hypothetical protein